MLIVVGLGNPGKKYASTYHNIGFNVVDNVAKNFNEKFSKTLCDSEIATFSVNDEKIILVKPQTYMNNSGFAVSQLVRKFKVNPATDLMVVSDDIDILPGTIRIRTQSHSSTHNGIKSIVEQLGTSDFMRLKVSIGPKSEQITLTNYVLARIKNQEAISAMEKATQAITEFINKRDIKDIMQKYSN